jgi:hypothetical protein
LYGVFDNLSRLSAPGPGIGDLNGGVCFCHSAFLLLVVVGAENRSMVFLSKLEVKAQEYSALFLSVNNHLSPYPAIVETGIGQRPGTLKKRQVNGKGRRRGVRKIHQS